MIVAGAPSSFADATPTPSPTPIVLTAMKQYKVAMDQYRIAMSEREQVRKNINKSFMDAVMAANKVAKKAMGAAKTADAKSTILAQQKIAVALANAARDAAIAAMGPAPIEPIKPVNLAEIAPLEKSKKVKPSPTP